MGEKFFQASIPWNLDLDRVVQRLSWDVTGAVGFSVLLKSDCNCSKMNCHIA